AVGASRRRSGSAGSWSTWRPVRSSRRRSTRSAGRLSTVEIGRARTSAVVTERDREITAWHEAGHALVAVLAEHVEDPTYVTIIPRGGSGGHTRPGGHDHQFLSRPEALDALAMAMGGRAAELMLLGEEGYTQGAS